MKIKELIQELHRFAENDLAGGDMELVLFDHSTGREFRVDVDSDVHDFEVLRGEAQVVIEFTS
jgi:hypothetical protein